MIDDMDESWDGGYSDLRQSAGAGVADSLTFVIEPLSQSGDSSLGGGASRCKRNGGDQTDLRVLVCQKVNQRRHGFLTDASQCNSCVPADFAPIVAQGLSQGGNCGFAVRPKNGESVRRGIMKKRSLGLAHAAQYVQL
jgi:hypothetical protein